MHPVVTSACRHFAIWRTLSGSGRKRSVSCPGARDSLVSVLPLVIIRIYTMVHHTYHRSSAMILGGPSLHDLIPVSQRVTPSPPPAQWIAAPVPVPAAVGPARARWRCDRLPVAQLVRNVGNGGMVGNGMIVHSYGLDMNRSFPHSVQNK